MVLTPNQHSKTVTDDGVDGDGEICKFLTYFGSKLFEWVDVK